MEDVDARIAEAIRDLREGASDLFRRAEEADAAEATDFAAMLWARHERTRREYERMEADHDYAVERVSKWIEAERAAADEDMDRRLEADAHKDDPPAPPTIIPLPNGGVAAYGDVPVKRLVRAAGYQLHAPATPMRREPVQRPRETKATRRARARAPGGDDDPSPSLEQVVLQAVESASPNLLAHLIELLVRRLEWLMTGRREER